MTFVTNKLFAVLAILFAGSFFIQAADKEIRFNRDIRPILSENCSACHGPDQNKRKAGLRLDIKGPAFEKLESGGIPVVPRDIAKSRLYQVITTSDEDDKMPPAKSGKHLTPEQTELIRRWIEQGAEWQDHWAYIKPERPAVPETRHKQWQKNEIDGFIAERLERAGLEPSGPADKVTLIRRASFDLRGLPPTIEEVDAFLADGSEGAYEQLLDRLLSSEQYGERMAQHWLDLARYADTNGYHIDNHRDMWKWREWVIKAFNDNKPFNQFTLEQLAGDMLPNPTLEQRVATGFNRNGMVNFEGGADPDEYQTKYVVDRVVTTSTVFLGTTLGCAECHDHKYDPFSQKDFYQMYAIFNNIPEKGLDGNPDNPVPSIRIPTIEQGVTLAELVAKLPQAELNFKQKEQELPGAQAKWEEEFRAKPPASTEPGEYLAHFSFDETVAPANDSRSQKATVFTGGDKPEWFDGIKGKALKLNGGSAHIEASDTADFERDNPFSIAAWVRVEGNGGVIVGKMDEAAAHRGFDFGVVGGKVWSHLIHSWETNALKVTSKATVPPNVWHHVAVTYDGSSKAAGLKLYINGKLAEHEVNVDALTDTIKTPVPLRIGRRNNSIPFNGSIDDLRIYSRVLSVSELGSLHVAPTLGAVLLANDKRTEEQRKTIAEYFRSNHAQAFKDAEAEVTRLRKEKDELFKQMASTMVMEEMPTPRKTHVLVRGDFRSKGEEVKPGVPSALPKLGSDMPPNRLGLAKWLTSPEHPLTARVTVNRFWQMLFGTGLVKTANDFGSQGEWPSHPELLDWLATEFMAKNWDVKYMLKLMMSSATYRQTAAVTPDRLEKDRFNRLLSRGPRFRLDAEMIRDQALFVSGLLNPKIGGRSVYPYQPPGLWEEVGFGGGFSSQIYVQSKGEDLYRRGLYTYWKRAMPYPSFVAFDAPNREICTFTRPRTSTPLQSLVLMNDPVYVEAARVLGARVLKKGGSDLNQRLTYAFRLALSRPPSARELELLSSSYREQLEHYSGDKEAAKALISTGESPVPTDVDASELAAWTAIGNILLNLDEAITKG